MVGTIYRTNFYLTFASATHAYAHSFSALVVVDCVEGVCVQTETVLASGSR